MLLQLQSYNLDVAHVLGKQFPIAETLSRNFESKTYPSLTKDLEALVHSVLANLQISERKLKLLEVR